MTALTFVGFCQRGHTVELKRRHGPAKDGCFIAHQRRLASRESQWPIQVETEVATADEEDVPNLSRVYVCLLRKLQVPKMKHSSLPVGSRGEEASLEESLGVVLQICTAARNKVRLALTTVDRHHFVWLPETTNVDGMCSGRWLLASRMALMGPVVSR